VKLPRAVVGRERRNLTLLLQDDDVPVHVVQEALEPVISGELAQLPPRRGEGAREDRRARAAERVDELRQVVLEREAVADEQHPHAAATAASELEIAARDGSEEAACETELDQPGVDGDAEQDPGADDERRSAEAAHQSGQAPPGCWSSGPPGRRSGERYSGGMSG
jgi:hypothetical protein